ncbi:uncharacterized protein LOC141842421 [Curcuma longa]|uniref:uncharacterized protein LOC141842421 n=1 Tax=Curcuma longa TaxID=136217 RepID=UPI003D9DC0B3
MEKIVSVDVNITDELSLSKHEDVEGNEQGGKIIQEDVASIEANDEKKKEDITIEEAKEEIASPAEDKGLHDTTDVPNTQPAEASEASISQDPVEAPKEIAQESFEISNSSLLEIDEHVEPSSQSNANDTKDPVGAPKELLEISETATEEEQIVQESTADVSATDDKLPEPLSEFVISTNGGESPFEAPKEHVISEIVDVSATDDKLPEPLSEFVISTNGGESPFEAPKEPVISEIVDVSATDDKLPEPLSEFVISTNGGESPFEAPKEPVISEIVAEEVKGVVEESSQVPGEDSSNVVKDDNRVEQVPETVSQEPSEATLVPTGAEEKPAVEEVADDTVEVSRHVPKEELPHSGATGPTECPVNKVHEIAQSESSDVVPTEPKQVQIETIVAELPSQKIDEERHAESHTQVVSEPEGETVVVSSDDTPTSEVAEGIAEPETEAKKKDQENNIDNEKITLTETAQSIAEGVEVSEDAENKNLQVQNPNLVELTRDIKLVGVETDAPSDNQLETESKPNKQTLQDKFANENTEEKKQETAQVDTGILTETNDATKADEAATKEELSGKKSKTIMSKVKQSIVKVKKALIGKSPSSKTMAPEGIDDTKAK